MPTVAVTLIGKPGCHLCDDARDVIRTVLGSLAVSDPALTVALGEVSILDDQALFDEHVEDIPVVTINDRIHTFWRVEPARFEAALRAAATE